MKRLSLYKTHRYDRLLLMSETPDETRVQILNEAADLITGQRQKDYGTPEENFKRIADLWNVHLAKNLKEPITPRQVAELMMYLKLARTINSPTKDSYVDAAGYAGIAGELAQSEKAKSSLIVDGEVSNQHISKTADTFYFRLTGGAQ